MFPFFFFNDTATTEIYTLSLHDALPIWVGEHEVASARFERKAIVYVMKCDIRPRRVEIIRKAADRKSTRLNSSHSQISYAVFCLKKKKKKHIITNHRTVEC